ncbi:MAG TPA: ParA family protein [Blastocatellia bacterium]|nr:ParA family protein [Blastocatellia bacterium]
MATSIVTISNLKGGVGKTVSVVNLAASYAQMGKRVLVVDMDPQGDATGYLGVEERASSENKHLAAAIDGNLSLEQIKHSTTVEGVDILAGTRELRDVQKRMEGELEQHLLLDSLLSNKTIIKDYDLVLIDTHPSEDCLLVSALYSSHYYLIPLFPERRTSSAVSTMIAFAAKIRRLNPMLMLLGCIITKFDRKSATHVRFESVLREGSKDGNIRIFETVIPSSSAVQGSESAEQPLIHYKPNAPVTIAYSALAGEILPGLKGKRQGKVSQPNLSAIDQIPDDFEIEITKEITV